MLGFGNWESSADISELHKKKAMRENETGVMELMEIDDQRLHIMEHTKAVIGNGDYDRDALMAHIREHERMLEMMEDKDVRD